MRGLARCGVEMMVAAVASVTMFGVVAFIVGFVFGDHSGQRRARIKAFNQCIDWAALAMKGHPSWRYLAPGDALLRAGALIGGDDVMPSSRPTAVPMPSVPPPLLTKGNQV